MNKLKQLILLPRNWWTTRRQYTRFYMRPSKSTTKLFTLGSMLTLLHGCIMMIKMIVAAWIMVGLSGCDAPNANRSPLETNTFMIQTQATKYKLEGHDYWQVSHTLIHSESCPCKITK